MATANMASSPAASAKPITSTGVTSDNHTANSAHTTPAATGRTILAGSSPMARTDSTNALGRAALLNDETRNTTTNRLRSPIATYCTRIPPGTGSTGPVLPASRYRFSSGKRT
jgi:hypothetical protein